MINENELHSLLTLLDDTDREVVEHVEQRILSYGEGIIPLLEQAWQDHFSEELQKRVEELIQRIHFTSLIHDLSQWNNEEHPDLLKGVWLIARYRYPWLQIHDVEIEIDRIKLDIWLEMHNVLSALEKVRVINHVIYNVHGFKGNAKNYHAPQNSFINDVLAMRSSNHIGMSIVYALVAQRLNLPVYGVNLPNHFLLCYKEENENWHYEAESYNTHHDLNYKEGQVLFYINAYNSGVLLTRKNLDQLLKQMHLEARPEFFEPCSNQDIIKRVLRNLFYAYDQLDEAQRCADVNTMLDALQELPLSRQPKNEEHDADEGEEE
jgi:regulator of sirC expression with transglutaminase-like and TPR domain